MNNEIQLGEDLKEDDIITVRIIGIRFELNDSYISCIGEIMNPKKKRDKVPKTILIRKGNKTNN